MNSLYLITSFSILTVFFLFCIVHYYRKKKRGQTDYYPVIVTCGFFMTLSFYLLITSAIDIYNYHTKNFDYAEGVCEITYFEEGYRSPSEYYIQIGDFSITAKANQFSFLKEGESACRITYLPITETLIDIYIK